MIATIGRRAVQAVLSNPSPSHALSGVRNGSGGGGGVWVYRRIQEAEPINTRYWSYIMSTFFWYWVFTFFYFEPEYFFGHTPPPDPESFTDEELGIPCEQDPDPKPSEMRVRKERPRFLPNFLVDYYHEKYGGSRILPRRAAAAGCDK